MLRRHLAQIGAYALNMLQMYANEPAKSIEHRTAARRSGAIRLTNGQRIQFPVAGNVQKHGSEFGGGFLAENLLEAFLGMTPQASRSLQYRPAFFGQLDVALAPVIAGETQHHQIITLQGLQVMSKGGSVHDHCRCQLAHRHGAFEAAAIHLREYGVLSGFDADGSQRSVIELRYAARRLAQAAAGTGV